MSFRHLDQLRFNGVINRIGNGKTFMEHVFVDHALINQVASTNTSCINKQVGIRNGGCQMIPLGKIAQSNFYPRLFCKRLNAGYGFAPKLITYVEN